MVSEVKGPGSNTISPLESTLGKVHETPSAPQAQASSDSDVVTLTDLAARLRRLSGSVDKLPVAELTEAIESGSYAIDERAIAEKLSVFEALIAAYSGDE